jgi:putative zinc finger/helix-turn-helix YgiT family protein
MYCASCENKKPIKGKKIVKNYSESGLKNVVLDGVLEYRCPRCGEVSYSYGDVIQLHQMIANALLTKSGQLSGSEIKFLRSHIGYSGAFFAEVLGIDAATLSRIENNRQLAGNSLDKHIREAVFNKEPDRNYDLHDAIINNPTKIQKEIRFKAKAASWVPKFEISSLVGAPA